MPIKVLFCERFGRLLAAPGFLMTRPPSGTHRARTSGPPDRRGGRRAVLLALLPALLGAAGQSPEPRATVIDEVFSRYATTGSPGCAISVSREGEIQLARAYGLANLEYGIPLTPRSVFHVASVSKQVTALAVQLLAEDGMVSWDDEVRTHVPEVDRLGAITLRQLAHHTSGLRDQWSLLRLAGWRFEADVVTQADILGLLAEQRSLNFAPGTDFLYSNSGYTLLAVVAARVAGRPLPELAARRIFDPLGMRRTHFRDDHRALVRDRAYAYAAAAPFGGYRLAIPDFATVGATSLFTTVEDLARWQGNFTTARVGTREGLAALHEVGALADGRRTTYAFGLAHGRHRGRPTVGHGGTDAGYRTEVLRFPDDGLEIAVLCNLASAEPDRLARRVADVFLAPSPAVGDPVSRPSRPPPTARAPSQSGRSSAAAASDPGEGADALAPWAGYYLEPRTDVPRHLIVRDGGLTTVGFGVSLRLVPTGPGRLRVVGSPDSVATLVEADGIRQLRIEAPGAPETRYRHQAAWRPAPDDLAAFVGRFASPELGVTYRFERAGPRLRLVHRKLGQIPLVPTYRDGFYGEGLYLAFTRAADAAVDGVTVSTPRAWKLRFERRPD